ncbi:VOC family protein (plasmid) [Rhizobium sp. WW22]|uniref:VOC family protein n=1 Tax=Rhizobium sp. WW22 TaxID=3389070 RepID=UPI00399C1E22
MPPAAPFHKKRVIGGMIFYWANGRRSSFMPIAIHQGFDESATMKVRQHLWFRRDMERAIELYTALIPGSAVGWISNILTDQPNGPAGSVKFAGFKLGNRSYMGFEAGPFDYLEHNSSVTVECATEDEASRLRYALGKGRPDDRSGVIDPWGIYWQFQVKSPAADVGTSAKAQPEHDGDIIATKPRAAAA